MNRKWRNYFRKKKVKAYENLIILPYGWGSILLHAIVISKNNH